MTFNLLTAWLAIWAFYAGQPRETGAPSSFTEASRHVAHVTEGIFGAIWQDVQLLVQVDTYTTYRPSLLAGLSDEARAMFATLPDDSLALEAPDDTPPADPGVAKSEEMDSGCRR